MSLPPPRPRPATGLTMNIGSTLSRPSSAATVEEVLYPPLPPPLWTATPTTTSAAPRRPFTAGTSRVSSATPTAYNKDSRPTSRSCFPSVPLPPHQRGAAVPLVPSYEKQQTCVATAPSSMHLRSSMKASLEGSQRVRNAAACGCSMEAAQVRQELDAFNAREEAARRGGEDDEKEDDKAGGRRVRMGSGDGDRSTQLAVSGPLPLQSSLQIDPPYEPLSPREERHTFLSERLFSEVLVKGDAAYHVNPLLKRILQASAASAPVKHRDEEECARSRENPLVQAMQTVLAQYGLRSVTRDVFAPLLNASLALCAARQETQRRRRREEGRRRQGSSTSGAAGTRRERSGSRKRRSTVASLGGSAGAAAAAAGGIAAKDLFGGSGERVLMAMPTDEEAAAAIAARQSQHPSTSASHIQPEARIDEADFTYLYRFLDWENYGCVDAGTFLARLDLLKQPLYIIQATIFVYMLFFKNAQGQPHLRQAHSATADGFHGADSFAHVPSDPYGSSSSTREEPAPTDLYRFQHERLSLVHQQQLITLLELESMLESTVNTYRHLRLLSMDVGRRQQQERKRVAVMATSQSRQPRGPLLPSQKDAAGHDTSSRGQRASSSAAGATVVALPEKQRYARQERKLREDRQQRLDAETSAREQQEREDVERVIAEVLQPACARVWQACAETHDGKFRVTVGQVRAALFESAELVAVLGDVVDKFLLV